MLPVYCNIYFTQISNFRTHYLFSLPFLNRTHQSNSTKKQVKTPYTTAIIVSSHMIDSRNHASRSEQLAKMELYSWHISSAVCGNFSCGMCERVGGVANEFAFQASAVPYKIGIAQLRFSPRVAVILRIAHFRAYLFGRQSRVVCRVYYSSPPQLTDPILSSYKIVHLARISRPLVRSS